MENLVIDHDKFIFHLILVSLKINHGKFTLQIMPNFSFMYLHYNIFLVNENGII